MPTVRHDHLAGVWDDRPPPVIWGDTRALGSEKVTAITAAGQTFERRQATVNEPRELLSALIRRVVETVGDGHELTLVYGADVTKPHLA